MQSVQSLNPNADLIDRSQALSVNISAAKAICNIMKSNLGPNGTMKMSVFLLHVIDQYYLILRILFLCCSRLVSGAGELKLTKDGAVLFHEMVCLPSLANRLLRLLAPLLHSLSL